MNSLIIISLFVGNLTVTSYRSVPQQTDSTPYHTSTNEVVRKGGAAVSRDLLCGACRRLHKRCAHPEVTHKIHYGDYVLVTGHGILKVNDVMGATKYDKKTKKRYPITNALDIWVGSYKEEKRIGVQKQNVYLINRSAYEKKI